MLTYSSVPGTLDVRRQDGVLRLTKRNARAGHAISRAMFDALQSVLAVAETDPDLSAVVIEAENGSFQAGAVMITQIKPTLADLDRDDFDHLIGAGQALGDLIGRLPCAVISTAPAGALGGGLELILRSDFIYCTHDARFLFPEVRLGLMAAWGGIQTVGRSATFRKAQEMLLLGDEVDGRTAEEIGLVTRSFPDRTAMDSHVERVLERLRSCPPEAFRASKANLARVWETGFSEGQAHARESSVACMTTSGFPALLARYNEIVGD